MGHKIISSALIAGIGSGKSAIQREVRTRPYFVLANKDVHLSYFFWGSLSQWSEHQRHLSSRTKKVSFTVVKHCSVDPSDPSPPAVFCASLASAISRGRQIQPWVRIESLTFFSAF